MGGERQRLRRWRGLGPSGGWVGEGVGGDGEQPFVHSCEVGGEVAAIGDDYVGEVVPECPVALAGQEADVAADVDDDGADRAATDFGGDFRFGGEACEARVLGGVGGLGFRLGVRRRGLALGPRCAGGGRTDGVWRKVLAAFGAEAQFGLEGRGETQAVGDAGEDEREVGGAEASGEAGEVWGGGALLDRDGDLFAEVDESAEDAEYAADCGGRGWGGPRWIGVGGRGRGEGWAERHEQKKNTN